MRVSVIQMSSGAEVAKNIEQARGLIDAAVSADRPDIVALPEVWSSLGGSRADKFASAEALPPSGSNEQGGPAYEFLRSIAREKRIHVHGGSIVERDGERLFNTTLVFDQAGTELGRYRKIHLFDIVTPDGHG
jgi:nitrilase